MCRKNSILFFVLFCCVAPFYGQDLHEDIENEVKDYPLSEDLGSSYLSKEAINILKSNVYSETLTLDSLFQNSDHITHPKLSSISSITLPLVYKTRIEPLNWRNPEKNSVYNKRTDLTWLENAIYSDKLVSEAKYMVCVRNPRIVEFDIDKMESGPTQSKLKTHAKGITVDYTVPIYDDSSLEFGLPKADRWIIAMNSAIQFSQNYVTDNWYQGGESNINVLSIQNLGIKFFDETGKIEFETKIDLKTGFYTTETDTVRSLRVNDNLLQINSKYGLKAIRKWYYTAAVNFKTQVFNSYKANTDELLNQFLSPAEINFSLGMDYKFTNKNKTFDWSVLLAPLSYNLRYVANIDEVDETRFGIDEGKHSLSQYGSSFTNNFKWKISKNIVWTSRLYYFTNYDKAQGDFENVFDFTISRYFSTKIQTHLRFDDDAERKEMFQFKELLSFGFNYLW